MKVMIELQNGAVHLFTDHMFVVGNKPLVLMNIDNMGREIKLGKVRRIFTSD